MSKYKVGDQRVLVVEYLNQAALDETWMIYRGDDGHECYLITDDKPELGQLLAVECVRVYERASCKDYYDWKPLNND